jgi:DNA-binding MarR family transcriptional regulator
MTVGAPNTSGPRDSVDRLLASWAAAQPELDLSPVAVIARLGRLRQIIDAELQATFAEYGLGASDFAALATLRRLDRPEGVSQRQLMRELHLSSGTVSLRVDRLNERGLVTRLTNPSDNRNSLVALTDDGHGLFDRVLPAHLATENRLLAALDRDQREQLVTVLRQLLISFEGWTSDDTFPRLGITLAPAHTTLEIRRNVGLPEIVGLLVRAVEPGSRAERAGLKTGDVLVNAARRPLRSATALYAAISQCTHSGTLTLTAIRGIDSEHRIRVDLRRQPGDGPPPGRTLSPHEATHTV